MTIDEHNLMMYQRGQKSNAYVFKCVLCAHVTCIDDSYSNQGKNLVCQPCAREHFKTPNELWNFLNGGKE